MESGVSNAYNLFDDHYFNYPLYTYMTLDAIGWQFAPVLLRVCVRYLANEIVPPVRPNTFAALLRMSLRMSFRSVGSEAVGNGLVGGPQKGPDVEALKLQGDLRPPRSLYALTDTPPPTPSCHVGWF
eukprot:COSAG04_NODE_355_length_16048_cov_133.443511_13_plen_127_part_00